MHFGCSNLMLHSKSPNIRRKTKRKVQYCQIFKWAKRVWNCINIGKMPSFQMNPHYKLFLLQTYSHLASETQTNLSKSHWWMGKNPLESYWGDYLVTFKGVSHLKHVNETITSKAYQDGNSKYHHPGPWWMREYFKRLLQGALSCWQLGA